jgi:hypothetical protein
LSTSSPATVSTSNAPFGDPRVEDHLEQDVTELVGEVRPVARLDGVHHLVGLLDEVGREALVGLLGVPRAAAGRAQPVHGRDDVEQPAPLDVPRPHDHLDPRGVLEPRHLRGDRVGKAWVTVGRAAPEHVRTPGEVDEGAGERRRCLVPAGDVDGHPGLGECLDERFVVRPGPHVVGLLDGLPGLAGHQPRRHPGRGEEERQAAGGHRAEL